MSYFWQALLKISLVTELIGTSGRLRYREREREREGGGERARDRDRERERVFLSPFGVDMASKSVTIALLSS